MTSLEIAEITGKAHKNVLADIRDEINKLGEERGLLIFQPSYYINEQNKKQPMFTLNLQGILQIGARYSADVRYQLIERVTERGSTKPQESRIDLELLDLEKAKIELERDRIKLEESKLKLELSNSYRDFAQSFSNEKYRETLMIYGVNALSDEPILALPSVSKKSYSAGEISQLIMTKYGIKVSSNRIGRLANQYNLKTSEYGYLAFDKAKHSDKQVESFRYYDNVIEELMKYI